MQMNPVTYGNQFRHEIKFICDLELATGLANYFKRNGFFKNFPDRRVTSIYYDSIDFRCARDNLAGISPRQKYRLRWYGSEEREFFGLSFETKIKVGSLGTKKRKPLDNVTLQQLRSGKTLLLDRRIKIDREFMLPTGIEPKLIVSYDRSYFLLKDGVRMTMDSALRFKGFNLENLNRSLIFEKAKTHPISGSNRIVELKWDAERTSSVSSLLRDLPSPATRCSKYLLGLSRTRGLSYL